MYNPIPPLYLFNYHKITSDFRLLRIPLTVFKKIYLRYLTQLKRASDKEYNNIVERRH